MLVDFSERLKRLRREKGYSQAALAQKVSDMGQNLSEAALAKYDAPEPTPTFAWPPLLRIILAFPLTI